jgi:hypothetical protein
MIKSYHIIHASMQHQLDNNIHVPLNHNKNQEYDKKNKKKQKQCNEGHTTKQFEKKNKKRKGTKTKKNINIEK